MMTWQAGGTSVVTGWWYLQLKKYKSVRSIGINNIPLYSADNSSICNGTNVCQVYLADLDCQHDISKRMTYFEGKRLEQQV
jgi:hypothetical protein